MKKNRALMLGMLMGTVGLMFGCSNHSNSSNLTEKEKTEILNSIILYEKDEGGQLSDLDKLITQNIKSFTQEEKDIAIESYTKNVFTFVSDLNTKLYTIGYELENVVKKYGVDIQNPSTFSKIPKEHAMVKGFLEELNYEGFTLEWNKDFQSYNIQLDYQEILDKYSTYMSKSLKAYIEYNRDEVKENNIFDVENESVNLKEVANKILKAEEGLALDKEQGYPYVDNWMSLLEYYYELFFGINHDYFVSSDYIKSDILETYKTIAKENEGTQLAEKINEVLAHFDENGKNFDKVAKIKVSKIVKGIFTDEIVEAIKAQQPQFELEDEAVSTDVEVTPSEETTEKVTEEVE